VDNFFTRGGIECLHDAEPSLIDIVIVNWNSGNQLHDCLESIHKFGGTYVSSVVVIDNGSTDDSIYRIERRELPLEIIWNNVNRGFAAACNQGAAACDAEYILFLNPDTLLFNDSIAVPLAFMEKIENSRVGICGIQLLDESGSIARSCARFPTSRSILAPVLGINRLQYFRSWNIHMHDWDHSSTRQVDHVIGAFFLVRRKMFNSLNGFDEQFFDFLEDLDFSKRAHSAGWRTIYLSEVNAFHAGGGTSRQIKSRRLFFSLRSRIQYAFKHFSLLSTLAICLVTFLIEPFIRSLVALSKGSWIGVKETWLAYMMLYRWMPKLLR